MRKKIFTFLLALVTSVGLMNAAVDGKLPGAFTVDGSGTQVYFSQGNLQATTADNGSTWTWGFAEHQYDFIGDAVANNAINGGGTVSTNGAVDLFGWSSDDNNYYGIDNSEDLTHYDGNFQDWGAKMGSDWRTLTYDEWNYLLNTRAPGSSAGSTSNPRFARAQIFTDGTAPSQDIYGLILFPDDFNDGGYIDGVTWNGINSYDEVSPTSCTTAGWATLESMGCVFLPASGWRSEGAVTNVGAFGLYWASTKSTETDEDASCMYFFSENVAVFRSYFKTGASVRLVSEIAPGGSTPANSCGDGLTWELNAGVFTISYDGVGTGVMDDFDYSEHPAPWQSSKESITSVIIPDGVTRIGNNAFSGAYNLASVSMGDDVVAIGNNAFEACNSLSSITLSSHVTTIGDHAFAGLQSLTSIVLPSTVQSIGTSAFYGNEGLTSITCEGTTPPTLGQYVFGMIGNGATLYVPYGYAETYESADSQWQALNIQVIGSGSASYPYCGDGLTWTYNNGVLTIIYDGVGTGDMLDYGNYNIYPWDSYKDDITSVIIPDGVIRIGNYAFANLTNLASVSMGDDVVEIGYGGFWNCLSIQSITLGSHVTTIGEHAFGSNQALTSITLPNTLQTIGGSAFYNCNSLPTITIPSSVTSFGEYAFGFCEGLTSFTCEGTTPPTLGQDVFTMVPYHRPLYVPDGYVETYQGADSQWQKFDISIIPAPTPAVDPAVQNVIDLINAIPNPVVYNQECFNALNAVFDAYVALSEEQRDQVTNYNDYLEAEARYYMLADVNYVIEKINEIGNVEFTSACKHKIDYARSQYCSLTLEQKGYVTNYNTLLAAEAAYAALIPVSSTVVWDEAILETINVDDWDVTTFTNNTISLKAVDGHAYYVDDEEHFLFDGSNSEKSFVFSCTSANILCIEITVSEKHEHNELSCAWQETATGYRWVGEATSVDLASTIFKVTGIRFSLGEAFPEPTPTPAQDGDKLPGAFSVDDGKVVYFSKGNLQYLGNIDRWHFAENQWTIIGNAQASNNRDLFSWGTGDNPDSEDYSTYTEWGNNIEGNWRTLTVEEWTYLFNGRTDASSKYGTATVAGVVGLILLPNVYDGTAINTERTAWDNNVISSSEWAAYEVEGAVFLPTAGMSDAHDVYGVGEQGLYWSSTMDALSYQSIAVFYGFNNWDGYWFNDVNAQTQPQQRLSVRLVSETAPTPTPTPVTSYVVEFALGDAEGTAPTTVDVTIGEDITMPVNKTMYKAGYTLTAWSDGVNTYPIGQPFTPANDVVLTPVFTANQADLLNASSDVTVKWYFGGDNGAPTTSYEGTSGLLVAQATIGDKTVDVKLAIDATEGRFAPQSTTEWANVKVGTIFTYPYKAGMTVNVGNYKSYVTYYIADAEGKVTCGENDTYSFIEVMYPASASTTAVVIGDPNDASQVETFLTTYNGQTVPELTIDRPVKNNMYNTLCLPFHMDAGQIAASSLNGVEIYEFTDADVVNDELYLYTSEQKHEIVAGRPYLVKYSAASQLDDLDFVNVVVNNADLDAQKVVINGVTFKGTFAPYWMVAQGDLNLHGGYLFLGQNNTLYWPNVSNYIKPFRAYFYVNVNDAPAGMPMRRGMPAHIGGPAQIPTGVGQVSQEPRANSQKVMENGVLYIIKNDVKYNVQGQIVK